MPHNSDFLGSLIGADMNATTDQAIPISATKYVVEKIIVTNVSTSLTLAAGGVYSTTAKGGTAIVAAGQLYSGLTGATKFIALTIAALTDVLSGANVYLSLTTAQGGAATADVYVYGRALA